MFNEETKKFFVEQYESHNRTHLELIRAESSVDNANAITTSRNNNILIRQMFKDLFGIDMDYYIDSLKTKSVTGRAIINEHEKVIVFEIDGVFYHSSNPAELHSDGILQMKGRGLIKGEK